MSALSTRPAVDADAPLLAALHAPCFPDEPWPADAMASLLESPGVFGLIGSAGSGHSAEAHGFILCRMAADEGEVLTLAVTPAARRSGLGGLLLERAVVWSAACGVRTLFLEVAEDNEPALALYRNAGFTIVGRRPGYYRRSTGSIAALVLSLGLTTP